jgi:predicted nucleic acid-binding protein
LKRLLLDVNVVLDFVLARAPFSEDAATLWSEAEAGRVEILVPAHGVTTVYYLAARDRGSAFAHKVIGDLLVVPTVAAVDAAVLRRALALVAPDFEDAVCAAAAEAARCDLLVTRDPRGYRHSPVTAVDPTTALAMVRTGSAPGETHERASTPPRRRRRTRPQRR